MEGDSKVDLNVLMRKLCDTKLQCDRKKVLEYINNLNSDGNLNIILILLLYNNII